MNARGDVAVDLMAGGANCAQAVLCAFCQGSGLDRETALSLATGLGAGMARKQEVCGAVTGGILALGLKHGQRQQGDKQAKERTYRLTREFMERFAAEFGSCLCRELLPGVDLATEAGQRRYNAEGWSEKVCRPCVRFAVRLLENSL